MNLTIPLIILLTLLSTSIKAATDCSLQTEIPLTECEALVALYTNTNGTNWTDSPANNWNITNTPCSWTDIQCTGGNIIILNRNTKNLVGTLPTELGNLTQLRTLSLSNNQLTGPIPSELKNLNKLRILSLSNNQLTGAIPAELGNLTNLKILGLANNQLTGPIPLTLANLNNLTLLALSDNQLTASDATLITFLNEKAPDWANTQTSVPNEETTTLAENQENSEKNPDESVNPTTVDSQNGESTSEKQEIDTSVNAEAPTITPDIAEPEELPTISDNKQPTITTEQPVYIEDKDEIDTPTEMVTPIVTAIEIKTTTTAAPIIDSRSCPKQQTLAKICNAKGRTITDLEILETGNLANAILEGTLVNHGWVSNLTITETGHLTGGKVTGYIKNQGTMKDFEFVGDFIIGGTLAGTLINNSEIGGYFQDVHFAPDTQLSGGYLIGNIIGDKTAPAQLEKVSIKTGSHIENVIIGADCELAENVTLGKGVRFVDNATIPVGISQGSAFGKEHQ